MQLIEDFTAIDMIFILSNGEPDFYDRERYIAFLNKANKFKEAQELDKLSHEDFDYLILEYAKEHRKRLLQ